MSLFDENAAILRDIETGGNNLGLPRIVDFSHIFSDEASAKNFAQNAERMGFTVIVQEVQFEQSPRDVTVSSEMVPTCANITETEEHLAALAQRHDGRSDGWGFFRL